MQGSSNYLEMMESRTLLSSAAHLGAFPLVAHSFAFADAVPFAAHFDHVFVNNGDEGHLAEAHPAVRLGLLELDAVQALPVITYRLFDLGDGSRFDGVIARFGDPDAPAYILPGAPHTPGSDDSDSHVTGRPARVSRPDAPDATAPADMTEITALRDVKPVEAVSTTLLHESAETSLATVAHAGTAMTSPFASMATITMQGVFQAAKSNMIYLSFLDQNTGSDPFFVSLAARLRSVIVSLPAIAVRETGVAVFASGESMISSMASQKSFEFAHFASPLMLVADSVGSFIQASTLAPFTANTPAAAARRAWAVTAAVLGVDVILLGYYYQKRRKAFAALATETVMSR